MPHITPSTTDSPRLAVERKRIILEILDREGAVRTAELRELLNVSMATIRSDLRELENAGICEVIWGGAVSTHPPTEKESLLIERSKLYAEEKRRIGARAAQLIESGQTVMVDAGSTTVQLISHLRPDLEYLRVVTPALNVAAAAAQLTYTEVILPGGILRNVARALVGPQTLRSLEVFNADWTFLASGAFSLEHGVTTSHFLDVDVKRTMAQRGNHLVLLADSSKFGKVLALNVVPMNTVHMLITDTRLSDANTAELEAIGVRVVRV